MYCQPSLEKHAMKICHVIRYLFKKTESVLDNENELLVSSIVQKNTFITF